MCSLQGEVPPARVGQHNRGVDALILETDQEPVLSEDSPRADVRSSAARRCNITLHFQEIPWHLAGALPLAEHWLYPQTLEQDVHEIREETTPRQALVGGLVEVMSVEMVPTEPGARLDALAVAPPENPQEKMMADRWMLIKNELLRCEE